ncbi:MAG TPA: hypothetical protein VIK52_02455 [Opitutaceae bacterium]
MKIQKRVILVLAAVAGILTSGILFANEAHKHGSGDAEHGKGNLVPASKADAAWLKKARAEYPLNECVVTGDEFDGGPMGKPKDFVYRQEGQQDQLVRFCCEDCVEDFTEEPAKYLAEIQAAAKPGKKE